MTRKGASYWFVRRDESRMARSCCKVRPRQQGYPQMKFSEILSSMTAAGDEYQVTVSDDWMQGRATFGGLVAAVGNEAMRRLVPRDRPLRSLQTTFIGPTSAGTWRMRAKVLRVGRAVTL